MWWTLRSVVRPPRTNVRTVCCANPVGPHSPWPRSERLDASAIEALHQKKACVAAQIREAILHAEATTAAQGIDSIDAVHAWSTVDELESGERKVDRRIRTHFEEAADEDHAEREDLALRSYDV